MVSALTYPLILFVVAALSVIIMLGFVVPEFEALFEDMGESLPFLTGRSSRWGSDRIVGLDTAGADCFSCLVSSALVKATARCDLAGPSGTYYH